MILLKQVINVIIINQQFSTKAGKMTLFWFPTLPKNGGGRCLVAPGWAGGLSLRQLIENNCHHPSRDWQRTWQITSPQPAFQYHHQHIPPFPLECPPVLLHAQSNIWCLWWFNLRMRIQEILSNSDLWRPRWCSIIWGWHFNFSVNIFVQSVAKKVHLNYFNKMVYMT